MKRVLIVTIVALVIISIVLILNFDFLKSINPFDNTIKVINGKIQVDLDKNNISVLNFEKKDNEVFAKISTNNSYATKFKKILESSYYCEDDKANYPTPNTSAIKWWDLDKYNNVVMYSNPSGELHDSIWGSYMMQTINLIYFCDIGNEGTLMYISHINYNLT